MNSNNFWPLLLVALSISFAGTQISVAIRYAADRLAGREAPK